MRPHVHVPIYIAHTSELPLCNKFLRKLFLKVVCLLSFLEFIEVGKKEPALDALYDVIKSKKHRTWQNKIHEPILFKYLELCVDLRRSHIAKEGLYQYKLICQQVNIVSLEDVIRYFLKLAEDRADAARQESRDQVPIVDDLDQIQTPERYLTCDSYTL